MRLSKASAFGIIITLFAIALTVHYMSLEENVYYWDYNGYWRPWQDFSSGFASRPFHSFLDIRHSVRHNDYNILPIAITAIFSILPVNSRLAYILSIVIVYLIPSVIMFSVLCRRFGDYQSLTDKVMALTLAVTFSAFWAPTLRGYPDICGLLFVIGSVLYCINFDMGAQRRVKKALMLGFLLWAPFLMRRWYAYTVVTLYISLPVLNYLFFAKGNYGRKRIINIVTNFFIAGVFSCVLALVFQLPLLQRIISTNYAYIYSAYQAPFNSSVHSLLIFNGIYLLPFVVLGIVVSCLPGRKSSLIFTLFCAFNLLFSFFLFTRTQTPGIQHAIPFTLWVLLIAGQGLLWLMAKLKNNIAQWIMIVVIAAGSLIILFHTLFDFKVPNLITNSMPNQAQPLRVENYPEYLALDHDIERLTAEGDKVTVLSSNEVLNDDMLNTISDLRLENRITYTSQVDLRDGINLKALNSKYFIVTDPVQIHLRADGQRVIIVPTEALLKHQNIGQAFKLLNREYKLNDKVSARIYERTRPFTPQEVDDFLSTFYQYYPQWKQTYSQGFATAFLSAIVHKGDRLGLFDVINNSTIYAHPGETTPTQVTWRLNGIKQLLIKSLGTNCDVDDTVHVSISGSGISSSEVNVAKGAEAILNIEPWNGKLSTLSISKNHSSGCDSLNIFAQ